MNLHPHDIEDILKRRRDCFNKNGIDKDVIESIYIFMKAYDLVAHIEYFQMGIESYQRKVNLTPPMLASVGIQKMKSWTWFTRPGLGLCLVYKIYKKQKDCLESLK